MLHHAETEPVYYISWPSTNVRKDSLYLKYQRKSFHPKIVFFHFVPATSMTNLAQIFTRFILCIQDKDLLFSTQILAQIFHPKNVQLTNASVFFFITPILYAHRAPTSPGRTSVSATEESNLGYRLQHYYKLSCNVCGAMLNTSTSCIQSIDDGDYDG